MFELLFHGPLAQDWGDLIGLLLLSNYHAVMGAHTVHVWVLFLPNNSKCMNL